MTLHVDIFEPGDPPGEPTLTHTVHGDTRADCERLIRTHAKYDRFLRAALTRPGMFKGIPLRHRERWEA